MTQSFSALLFPCFFPPPLFCISEVPCHFFPLETLWMDSVSSYPVEYLLLWFWWFSRSSYPSTQDNSGQLVSSLPRLELRVTTAFHPLSYTACLYPDPPQPYPPYAVLRFYCLLPWDTLLFFFPFFGKSISLLFIYLFDCIGVWLQHMGSLLRNVRSQHVDSPVVVKSVSCSVVSDSS